MKWIYQNDNTPKNFNELRSILLENRQITNTDNFFSPEHPKNFTAKSVGIDEKQFDKALKRIELAVKNKEKVVIFGDYDADGITATAILWESLNYLDLQAKPFIPDRKKHGYGLSVGALEDIFEDYSSSDSDQGEKSKPDLIITVDNGIVAHSAAKFLKEQNVDLIITDHHQPEDKKPKALAIVHTTKIAGAGVAWMLAKALTPDFAISLLDFVGVATVADLVPLVAENRSFAKFGVDTLKTNKRIGIESLRFVSGLDKRPIDAELIGFGIAPRINAMGRLAHGLDALRLLCTRNKKRAQELALLLNNTNTKRRQITIDLVKEAILQAKDNQDQKVIIVSSENYHEGVVGLIAGKIAEEFSKPAIVISIGDDIAKASARSVAGVNIIELIRTVKADLIDAGGHPMAAGFSLKKEKTEEVKTKLEKKALETIDDKSLEATLMIDCRLPASLVDFELVDSVESFRPFGRDNSKPLFVIENLELTEVKVIGKNKNHLRCKVRVGENGKELAALFWNKAKLSKELNVGDKVSIAARVDINDWNGNQYLQFIGEDVVVLK